MSWDQSNRQFMILPIKRYSGTNLSKPHNDSEMLMVTCISAFQASITKPGKGETWTRGQSSNAVIEWATGDTPVTLPASFPKTIDIWFADKDKKKISKITEYNPSTNARWVFDSKNVVPTSVPDGDYYIQLVNSLKKDDVANSPNMVTIKGGKKLNTTDDTANLQPNSSSSTSESNTTSSTAKTKKAIVSTSIGTIYSAALLGFIGFILY
eukprot:NODE_326_length_10940_cov_0.392122.p5 type:complete len:210 gc:universal NODE_326_length_10940_cov_0.392122:10233-10862(+)